jgi:hypothetical protein
MTALMFSTVACAARIEARVLVTAALSASIVASRAAALVRT